MSQTEITNRQIQSKIAGLVAGVNWGQTFIGEMAVPPVNAGAENYIYELWGNEGLEDVGEIRRGLRAATKQVTQPKNSSASGTLDEYAAFDSIDYRELNAARVQDQLRGGETFGGLTAEERLRFSLARRLNYAIQIQKEKAIASVLFTNTNYSVANRVTDCDFGATGIVAKFDDYKRTVQKTVGFAPDTLVCGYTAWVDLHNNSDILARITGGSNNANPAVITESLVAQLLGVRRILVGTAVSQTLAAAGSAGTATDIWTADSACLIYTGEFESADLASPAFAKLFYMNVPETGVRQNLVSWISDNGKLEYQEETEFFKAAVTMSAAGIHFTNTDQA